MTDKFDYLNAPERFFSAFPDPSVFDFEGDNLSKLFLDEFFARQFARSVPAWSPQRGSRTASGLVINLIRFIRALGLLVAARLSASRKKTTLFFGSNGRTIEKNGAVYDIFNHRVVRALGEHSCLIVEPVDGGGRKVFQPDFFLHDLILLRLGYQLFARKRIRLFVRRLLASAASPILTEKEGTQILAKFLANRWIFSIILRSYEIQKGLVICHYGKESFTSACKSLHIPVVELMHGLIFASNPNYCFAELPGNYRQALRSSQLPDKIGIFGALWADILGRVSYFNKDELFTAGYYLESSIFDEANRTSDRRLTDDLKKDLPVKRKILISTQPIYQDEIIRYVNFLKAELDRNAWVIVLKPHPAEKKEAYENVVDPGFVDISTASVYSILPGVHFHISVTSSVLFEAVYFPVSNYVLYVEGQKRICDEIIATGVARRLDMDALPAEYRLDPRLKESVFSDFNESALIKALH